jgi:hypothetical protein
MGGSHMDARKTDIEQVRFEEKFHTLHCMSYGVNVTQSGGCRMASVSVERLDHLGVVASVLKD